MNFNFGSLIQTLGINKFLDYTGLVVLADEIKKWANGHVMAFGADGYTPKDTGFTIGKSVLSNVVFTDTKYNPFTGSTSSGAGAAGLVPQPQAADMNRFLSGDGTWKDISIPDIQAITQEEIEAPFK